MAAHNYWLEQAPYLAAAFQDAKKTECLQTGKNQ